MLLRFSLRDPTERRARQSLHEALTSASRLQQTKTPKTTIAERLDFEEEFPQVC
jgi:hypothetical protein